MCDYMLSDNLDELLNKEEYENTKLLRLINYEREKQSSLQIQIDKLSTHTSETEKQNDLLVRAIDEVERQVTVNQSIITTLSCANKMAHQHVNETHKKLARLEEAGRKRAAQYETALHKYQDTWSNYQAVYCSFSGVPQLMLLEDEIETLKNKVKEMKDKAEREESKEPYGDMVPSDNITELEAQREQQESVAECVVEDATSEQLPMESSDTDRTLLSSKQVDEGSEQMVVDSEEVVEEEEEVVVEDGAGNMEVEEPEIEEVEEPGYVSPYFTGDSNQIEVPTKPPFLPPSSTPNLASGTPSISAFITVSPVPNIAVPNIPVPNIPDSTSLPPAAPTPPCQPPASSAVQRTIPLKKPQLTNKLQLAAPASPCRAPIRISVPKLLRASPTSSPSPKIPCPKPSQLRCFNPGKVISSPSRRVLSKYTSIPQAGPARTPTKPSSFQTLTPKLVAPKLTQPTTPKMNLPKAPAKFKTPKISVPKPAIKMVTPKMTIPKMMSPKMALPKMMAPKMSTPKFTSAITTPKIAAPKALSASKPAIRAPPQNFASAAGRSGLVTPRADVEQGFVTPKKDQGHCKEDYYTPAETRYNAAKANDSVYTTPCETPRHEVESANFGEESSFTLDQFKTPVSGGTEAMFGEAQTNEGTFNFGFNEPAESTENSAFGMFGGDSSGFGEDSGFGGDSGGFAFNFGGSDDITSSESNCNALFG